MYMSHYDDRRWLRRVRCCRYPRGSSLLSASCYTSELSCAARGHLNDARVDGLNGRGTSLAIRDGSYSHRSWLPIRSFGIGPRFRAELYNFNGGSKIMSVCLRRSKPTDSRLNTGNLFFSAAHNFTHKHISERSVMIVTWCYVILLRFSSYRYVALQIKMQDLVVERDAYERD